MSSYMFAFYLLSLIIACVYVAGYGGRTGRWACGIQLSMAILSAIVSYFAPNFAWVLPRMLAIDTLSLALKCTVAFKSNRYWPIWIAAFQLNTVLSEIAILISPKFNNFFFHAMATAFAVPTLVVMALGVYRDNLHDRQGRTIILAGQTNEPNPRFVE